MATESQSEISIPYHEVDSFVKKIQKNYISIDITISYSIRWFRSVWTGAVHKKKEFKHCAALTDRPSQPPGDLPAQPPTHPQPTHLLKKHFLTAHKYVVTSNHKADGIVERQYSSQKLTDMTFNREIGLEVDLRGPGLRWAPEGCWI